MIQCQGKLKFYFERISSQRKKKKKTNRAFPGSPVVKTLCFHNSGQGFSP